MQWQLAGHSEPARSLGHPVPVLRDPLRRGVRYDEVELGGERDAELLEHGERFGDVVIHDNRRRLERIHA